MEQQFQLLTAHIALAGDRDQVVYRGPDDPITYPESIVLGVTHGVTSISGLTVVGFKASSTEEERERLSQRYGEKVVADIFPMTLPLPAGNPALPTQEEVDAANAAAADASAKVRAKSKTPAAKPAPVLPAVPSLEQLPE